TQLEAINAIAQQTTAVLDLKELLSKVCLLIGRSFQVSHVSVLLKDENDLVLRASHGALTSRVAEGGRLSCGAGPWGRALEAGKTLVENDAKSSSELGLYHETHSRMCIPLVSFGQALGVLVLDSERPEAFQSSDSQALESVADICANAIQNAHYV